MRPQPAAKTARPRPHAPQPEPAARVLRQFRQVLNTVKTHFQQVEKTVGVGGAQVWAMHTIRQQPGIGVTGLAQAMDIHQSTASNLVRSLVDKAYVEVQRSDGDRRTVQLHLLPAGGRLLKKVPGPFEGLLPNALQALDAATLRRLERDLATLIGLLHADAKAGRIPLAGL